MDVLGLIDSLAQNYPWSPYLIVFAAPFVQEDAAVVGTAALTALGKLALGPALAAIFLGLFFSDAWKYWIGWAALRNATGAEFSKKSKVLVLKEKVETFPFTTLMGARFIPLTRIPAYIACGFFGVSYTKYCIYIAITAGLYIAIFFAAFHYLGVVMAEQLKWILPIIGVLFVAIVLGASYVKSRAKGSGREDD